MDAFTALYWIESRQITKVFGINLALNSTFSSFLIHVNAIDDLPRKEGLPVWCEKAFCFNIGSAMASIALTYNTHLPSNNYNIPLGIGNISL